MSDIFQSFHSLPFDTKALNFEYTDTTWIVLLPGSAVYQLMLHYISESFVDNNNSLKSFTVSTISKPHCPKTLSAIGLGSFTFIDQNGSTLHALHQCLGEPVGSSSGAERLFSLVIFFPKLNNHEYLARFCEYLVDCRDLKSTGKYSIFYWSTPYEEWDFSTECLARPLKSVILSRNIKKKLLDDIEHFINENSEQFYEKHGIPYRRSYLFFGVPGSGKTSLIKALAGEIQRNLYFIQPTHPLMTDNLLRQAIEEVPERSIIVMEDIDALFQKDRTTKVKDCPLTFSGLLNALDGVGDSTGQIFILTTNLRDQLDSALIRNGRVDMQVEFGYALEEQMNDMWLEFYPHQSDMAPVFARELMKILEGKKITTAMLQHFFILNIRKTATEALARLELILEEIRQNEEEEENHIINQNKITSCDVEANLVKDAINSEIKLSTTENKVAAADNDSDDSDGEIY